MFLTAHTADGGVEWISSHATGLAERQNGHSRVYTRLLQTEEPIYSTAYIQFNSNILLAVTHIAPPCAPQ